MEHERFQEFIKYLHLLDLPSTLWAIHVDPKFEYFLISHIQITSLKPSIDKALLIWFDHETKSICVSTFINNENVRIPLLSSCLKTVPEISQLVQYVDNLKLCPNFKDNNYQQCNGYINLSLSNGLLCLSCQKQNEDAVESVSNQQVIDYDASINVALQTNAVKSTDSYVTVNKEQVFIETYDSKNGDTEVIEFNHQINNSDSNAKLEIIQQTLTSTDKDNIDMENCFVCEICHKRNKKLSSHQRHLLTHSEEKINLCNICGKTFCSGYNIKDHLLTHSTERPFKCDTCDRGFSRHFNLKLHQKTHLGIRPFICNMCGKTYTTTSNLRTHIRSVHTKSKPHRCANCDMSFVHPRHLKLHMRIHTGEKPYKCKICPKTFTKNIHLTVHMRTHTGERPHICEFCSKGFTTTGNLNAHIRVHHKFKPT